MKPWFSSGSIAELGSHMEGMSYDICIYLLYLPMSEYVFLPTKNVYSILIPHFRMLQVLSPIFGWISHAPVIKCVAPRSCEARRLGEVGREGLRRSQGAPVDFRVDFSWVISHVPMFHITQPLGINGLLKCLLDGYYFW